MTAPKEIHDILRNQEILMNNQLQLLKAIKGEKIVFIDIVKTNIKIEEIEKECSDGLPKDPKEFVDSSLNEDEVKNEN